MGGRGHGGTAAGGAARAAGAADLLTVTEEGYGKRTAMSEYLVHSEDGQTRPQGRGGKGRRDIQTGNRNGRVADIRAVRKGDSLMFISAEGMLVRIPADDISRIGRNTKGVRIVSLKDDDRLIAAGKVEASDEAIPA